MFRATFKSLLSRKVRLVLSGLAIVLGVAAASGALIVGDYLDRAMTATFAANVENLDVQVTAKRDVEVAIPDGGSAPKPIPATVVDEVAAIDGVDTAKGSIVVNGARVVGHDGKVIALRAAQFGEAWNGDNYRLREGRGPTAPNEVAINAGFAKKGDFTLNEQIEVLTLQPKQTFTIVGIFGYDGGQDSLNGESRIAFTEPVAAELMLGERGTFSSIDVTTSASAETVKARIAEALGDDYTVKTAEEVVADQAAQLNQILGVVRGILLGFAGVALFVGIFLILNTFSILVAQRTSELALLRALGASRGQLIGSVLLEASVIGIIAATLGLAAGYGIAHGLILIIDSARGAEFPDVGMTIPVVAVAVAYGVGLFVTVLAALMPAFRASKVAPIAAMRTSAATEKPLGRLTVGGLTLTLAGVGAIGWALAGDEVMFPFLLAGVGAVFLGVVMATPALARPSVALLGHVFTWGLPGKLGQRNSARNPRRTAITASALMVGITLVTGVTIVADSLKTSIDRTFSQEVSAELIIDGVGDSMGQSRFDPAVLDQVRSLDGVREATGVFKDFVRVGESNVQVSAVDVSALRQMMDLNREAGEVRDLAADEALVDTRFAEEHGLSPGKSVEVSTQRGGKVTFTVVGVYSPLQALGSPMLLPESAVSGFASDQASQGFIRVADGVSVSAIESTVNRLLKDNPEVSASNQAEYAEQQTSRVDMFVIIVMGLLGLALLIALLGIINTLALSIVERTRELGLLRAIGLGRLQVAQMVTVESVVISVFGALLGVGVGLGLGAALVAAMRDNGISTLTVPWIWLVGFAGLAVVVGLIAAVGPAVKAARVKVLQAISYE